MGEAPNEAGRASGGDGADEAQWLRNADRFNVEWERSEQAFFAEIHRRTEAAAKAMFERHNSNCLNKMSWDDVPEKAKQGYRADAKLCFRIWEEGQ